MSRNIFHIGLPKTGTSTIQHYLMSSGRPEYLGKAYRSPELEYLFRHVVPFGDLRMAPVSELREYRALMASGGVVSDEIMSGVGFMHGVAANSLLQVLDNLSVLTDGDYKAIVVYRKPADFLRSYHAQLVRMGGRVRFDQFCSLVLLRRHTWIFRSLFMAPILEFAERDDRINIYYFEDIFSSALAFHEFMGHLRYAGPPNTKIEQVLASYGDGTVDELARSIPHNPALSIELPITRPSLEEYQWIGKAPYAHMHQKLWEEERAEMHSGINAMVEIQRQVTTERLPRGNRENSEIYQELVSSIAQANSSISIERPTSGAVRHRYF